jgi:predicted SprT family Zn-dependent metalloprotease
MTAHYGSLGDNRYIIVYESSYEGNEVNVMEHLWHSHIVSYVTSHEISDQHLYRDQDGRRGRDSAWKLRVGESCVVAKLRRRSSQSGLCYMHN